MWVLLQKGYIHTGTPVCLSGIGHLDGQMLWLFFLAVRPCVRVAVAVAFPIRDTDCPFRQPTFFREACSLWFWSWSTFKRPCAGRSHPARLLIGRKVSLSGKTLVPQLM
jgi:hypothetical protein